MTENKDIFKIITLGDSRVSKTSIIKRFTEGTFDFEIVTTMGVGFSYKEVTLKDGTKI